MQFSPINFAELQSQITLFCHTLLAKFGKEECDHLALGESTELKLGWHVFWLKDQFEIKAIRDVKDLAKVQALQSVDGPLTYLKQICGPIIKY